MDEVGEPTSAVPSRPDQSACTIVIPTYDRPAFLGRLLRYYADSGTTRPIVVADSSADEAKQLNRDVIASLDSLEVSHFDHYAHDTSPYAKLADAAAHVATPYSVVCADDDFTTEWGIGECAAYLAANPDYSIAQGYCVVFSFDAAAGAAGMRWQQYLATPTVSFPEPLKRLYYHLSAYQATYYAVHRTAVLRVIMEEAAQHTDDIRFGELLPSMLSVVMGKCRHLDVLFAARQTHPGMLGSHIPTFSDFVTEGSYERKYGEFRERILAGLVDAGANAEASGMMIDSAMSNYFAAGPSVDQRMETYLGDHTKSGSAATLRAGFQEFLESHQGRFDSEIAKMTRALTEGAPNCRT